MAGDKVPVDNGDPENAARDDGLRALLRMKPRRHEDMKLGKPRNPNLLKSKKNGLPSEGS